MLESKFGKIVLAVIGTVLMLAFVLPAGFTNMAGRNVEVGEVNGEAIRPEEVRAAQALFQRASRIVVPTQQGLIPLTSAVFGNATAELEGDPLTFYLLLLEAAQNGSAVTAQQVAEQLTALNAQIRLDPQDGQEQTVEFANLTGEGIRTRYLQAAKAVLDVNQSRNRYTSFVKISRPVADYALASTAQEVTLDAVPFDAEDYVAQVPAPEPSAMQEQFETYKDNPAGNVTPENPFGFGYRLPDRVKFQYLAVERADVEAQVRQQLREQSLRERELALYGYWRENRTLFPAPTTQPTTPTTQPATQPGGSDALTAEANPEVRQFLDEQSATLEGQAGAEEWQAYVAVHDDVVERYLTQQANALETRVMGRAIEILNADYRQFEVARKQNETAPETRVGVPVTADNYLESVADAVAEREGVRPTVRSYGREFTSVDQLGETEAVGPIAEAFLVAGQGQFLPFPIYLGSQLIPLLEGEQAEQAEESPIGLSTFEPSQVLSDTNDNVYVFRATEALDDAPPASLAEVEQQVREDLKLREAYQLALKEAAALVEQARETGSLQQAASDRVRRVDAFVPGRGPLDFEPLGGPLTQPGLQSLADGIYAMLPTEETAADNGASNTATIELPSAGRVLAAQVVEVVAPWMTERERATMLAAIRQQLSTQVLQDPGLASEFLSAENVAERVGFTGRDDEEDGEEAAE